MMLSMTPAASIFLINGSNSAGVIPVADVISPSPGVCPASKAAAINRMHVFSFSSKIGSSGILPLSLLPFPPRPTAAFGFQRRRLRGPRGLLLQVYEGEHRGAVGETFARLPPLYGTDCHADPV